ncbi:MAG: hydrogenase subunit MbhD domain-containing protein [Limnothrix sp.]
MTSGYDFYTLAIALLLPLMAGLLVLQKNPYHALVIRGILGAIAALLYALLGAADVALTEALVGTMLSITLYAVAVRSSMSMRLGILTTNIDAPELTEQLFPAVRTLLNPYHLGLETFSYTDLDALKKALTDKEIQAIAYRQPLPDSTPEASVKMLVRLPRLYEILKSEQLLTLADLSYIELNSSAQNPPIPPIVEPQS